MLVVLEQVSIIFMLMFIGVVLVKLGVLCERSISDLTTILLTLVTPCVILHAFFTPFNWAQSRELFATFFITFLFFVVTIIAVHLIVHKMRVSDIRPEIIFGVVYSNNGFMGIPLVSALFGVQGVFFAASQLALALAFLWSHGILQFRTHDGWRRNLLKIITNPAVVSLMVSMILYFSGISLFSPVEQIVTSIAQMNTPLSMILVGATLVGINIKDIIADQRVWLATLMRNLIIPILFTLSLYYFDLGLLSNLAKMTLIVMIACPVPALTVMFARQYDTNARFAAQLVSFSTIASVVTLPAVIFFALRLFPVVIQ